MFALLMHALFLISFSSPSLTLDGPAELQGAWKLSAVESNGETRTLDEFQPRLRIKGNSISYAKTEIARLTADPSAAPHTIDLQFLDPKRVFEGVYAVEGKTLTICVNSQTEGVKERPNALSTKGQPQWRIMVFEKESGISADEMEGVHGYIGMALRADEERTEIVVGFLVDKHPAQKAGILKDDVVLKVGSEPATSLQGTVNLVRKAKPQSKIDILIRRAGRELTITVPVGVRPFTTIADLDT